MSTPTETTQTEGTAKINECLPVAATPTKSERVRELNDHVRRTFTGGVILVTAGVQALDDETKAKVLSAVREFDEFGSDNDPHLEHDFGSFDLHGTTYYFKFDYFDLAMRFHSPDPADPEQTRRALTIMRADEY